MARPRKPKAELEASGAFKKNPQRAASREHEPAPTSPLGPPPAHYLLPHSLIASRKLAIWRELEEQMLAGVVTGCDRWIFEDACEARYEIRFGKRSAGWINVSKACLTALGLTPQGRTQVAQRIAKSADTETPEGWAALSEEIRAATARVQ